MDRKVAYSREKNAPKTYVQVMVNPKGLTESTILGELKILLCLTIVQELIRQHAYLIWCAVWVNGGSIFVCGKVLIVPTIPEVCF